MIKREFSFFLSLYRMEGNFIYYVMRLGDRWVRGGGSRKSPKKSKKSDLLQKNYGFIINFKCYVIYEVSLQKLEF